jgi:hypothetical protein
LGVIEVVLLTHVVFVVLVLIAFLIGRLCCDTFGGRNPELDFEEYRTQRIVIIFWITVISLCMLFGIAVGITGCAWLASPGANDLHDKLDSESTAESEVIKTTLLQFRAYDPDIESRS